MWSMLVLFVPHADLSSQQQESKEAANDLQTLPLENRNSTQLSNSRVNCRYIAMDHLSVFFPSKLIVLYLYIHAYCICMQVHMDVMEGVALIYHVEATVHHSNFFLPPVRQYQYMFPSTLQINYLTLSSDDSPVHDTHKADEQKMAASTLPSQRVVTTNDSSAKEGEVAIYLRKSNRCVCNDFPCLRHYSIYLQMTHWSMMYPKQMNKRQLIALYS